MHVKSGDAVLPRVINDTCSQFARVSPCRATSGRVYVSAGLDLVGRCDGVNALCRRVARPMALFQALIHALPDSGPLLPESPKPMIFEQAKSVRSQRFL